MGAYNVLITDVQCSNCKNFYEGKIQFKYGDTWQLQYRIGDKIKWGGNDTGVPNVEKIKAYGILETDRCPICNQLNAQCEFDIYIEKDVIIQVGNMRDISDYFTNEGNYQVL
jgi:hypothetical protein